MIAPFPHTSPRRRSLAALCLATALSFSSAASLLGQDGWSVYISADMEGLTGVGAPAMTERGGKDYDVGRRMQTGDINAVIAGIRAAAEERDVASLRIVVNDSHGDHANAYIEQLSPGVEYVQGSIKPLGILAELDETFDAAMYIGYHARAGTRGFLAHTGSGLVGHLEINGVPSGEGEMNAAFAGAHGVPVVLVHGDQDYVDQARETYARDAETVVSKTAVTARSAHLRPIDEVRRELVEKARKAMLELDRHRPWVPGAPQPDPEAPGHQPAAEPARAPGPFTVELTVGSTTHVDIALAIPGVERVSPTTVRFTSDRIRQAYAMIRLLYRFISI